ncbi:MULTISPECIES: hypothetical protein [Rhizobium]|uniref:Uncharacterized protein n=1 Tax=Rhizobium chutanense TaxID=2035448 RepID=A0A432P6X0_9HYPH|nr:MULTISPECIES: hypothetical protein [Rhizobium]RUM08342.1 hypothetical protein EFR84_06010 [Rhizobium chutanense]WEA58626.1 hypothetical protein PO860_12985 [Rhizobium sp. BJ04]
MMTSDPGRRGFKCDAIVDPVALSEMRANLEALVRTYGELLAVYSFMHLASREKSMRLLAGELADRAADIKRSIRDVWSVSLGFTRDTHTLGHLENTGRLLVEADGQLQRGVFGSDATLLRLLANAATELKRSAAILGTTTFDTSTCCGGSLFGNGEGNHGSTFDLGA